jgi:hypothetical protein
MRLSPWRWIPSCGACSWAVSHASLVACVEDWSSIMWNTFACMLQKAGF